MRVVRAFHPHVLCTHNPFHCTRAEGGKKLERKTTHTQHAPISTARREQRNFRASRPTLRLFPSEAPLSPSRRGPPGFSQGSPRTRNINTSNPPQGYGSLFPPKREQQASQLRGGPQSFASSAQTSLTPHTHLPPSFSIVHRSRRATLSPRRRRRRLFPSPLHPRRGRCLPHLLVTARSEKRLLPWRSHCGRLRPCPSLAVAGRCRCLSGSGAAGTGKRKEGRWRCRCRRCCCCGGYGGGWEKEGRGGVCAAPGRREEAARAREGFRDRVPGTESGWTVVLLVASPPSL